MIMLYDARAIVPEEGSRSLVWFAILSTALAVWSCGADSSGTRDHDGGSLQPEYSELLIVPDRVTLLGAAHGRPIRVLGRTSAGELAAISSDKLVIGSSDESVVRTAGGRLRGVAAGRARVEVAAGERRASIEVDVLSEPPPFASAILEQHRGEGDGFGRDRLPDVVLGAPQGGGSQQGSFDTLSLGIGGAIVLGFSSLVAYDGPGVDLIVFENAFAVAGSNEIFAEPGVVGVSFDGGAFVEFECEANDPPFRGCAGTRPVWAGSDPDVDATDPERAGGDAFDLDRVLFLVDRVRVRDAGNRALAGNASGFDLDALALVHALTSDVRALSTPVASLRMRIGEERPLPRIDALRADGRSISGVPVKWVSGGANAGTIAFGEIEIVRAVGLGAEVLRAIAGPYSIDIPIEVIP